MLLVLQLVQLQRNALADDKAASEAQTQQEEEKGGIPGWIWILLAAAVASSCSVISEQKKN